MCPPHKSIMASARAALSRSNILILRTEFGKYNDGLFPEVAFAVAKGSVTLQSLLYRFIIV